MVSWAIVGMHPPINPIRSRWIRPAPGPLWTHLLEVPLPDQKELDLGHDKTDLKSSGSAIIIQYTCLNCLPEARSAEGEQFRQVYYDYIRT